MYRIKRTKESKTMGRTAVHWAVEVSPKGDVLKWSPNAGDAGEFGADVCSAVEEHYNTRPKAGVVKFVDAPVVTEKTPAVTAATIEKHDAKKLDEALAKLKQYETERNAFKEQYGAKSKKVDELSESNSKLSGDLQRAVKERDKLAEDYELLDGTLKDANAKIASLEEDLKQARTPLVGVSDKGDAKKTDAKHDAGKEKHTAAK